MTETNPAQVAELLSSHPFFARLTPQLRRWLGGRVKTMHVQAGTVLFEQDQVADALYLVTSGRIELWQEGAGAPALLSTVGRGGSLGEIALLTAEPQEASARALRDSELVGVDRALFLSLIHESRSFSAALLSYLGETLARAGQLTPAGTTKRSVLTITSYDVTPGVESILGHLVTGLSAVGPTAVVLPDGRDHLGLAGVPVLSAGTDEASWTRSLDAIERSHQQVLLVGGPARVRDPWTDFCLRQADRIMVLAGPRPPADSSGAEQLTGAELVLAGPVSASARSEWLDRLKPRAHFDLDPVRPSEGIGRLARRITGRSLGVVLSGGGARGLAHIGVLSALVESGLTVDRIGGTSMGAFIGALFAQGAEPREIVDQVRRELVERRPFHDYTVPVVSLARGHRARTMMTRLFGDNEVQDLLLDFFCVTADLVAGEAVIHRRGSVIDTVGASMSIPGWAPPTAMDGRVLVDGGVLNNFPVDIMLAVDEGPVIGVEAMGMSKRTDADSPAPARSPRAMEVLAGAVTLGSRRLSEVNAARADLLIRPVLGKAGLLEFSQLDNLFAAGRRAALEALEQDGQQISRRVSSAA